MRAAAAPACALLKTRGNPDRLMLLCRLALAQGGFSVGQLEALLGIVQPTLSQQLGMLREKSRSAPAAKASRSATSSSAWYSGSA